MLLLVLVLENKNINTFHDVGKQTKLRCGFFLYFKMSAQAILLEEILLTFVLILENTFTKPISNLDFLCFGDCLSSNIALNEYCSI